MEKRIIGTITVIVVVLLVMGGVGIYFYLNWDKAGGKKVQPPPPEVYPPVAHINISTIKAVVGDVIVFNSSGSSDPDGEILFYDWDFGDTVTNRTNNTEVTHTYQTADRYEVSLTVTDDQSLVNKTTVNVTVIPQNVPIIGDGIIIERDNPLIKDFTNVSFEKLSFDANLTVNITLMGVSRDLSASVDVSISSPDGVTIFNRSYSFTARQVDKIVLEPDELVMEGFYDIHFKCMAGGVYVSYDGHLTYL